METGLSMDFTVFNELKGLLDDGFKDCLEAYLESLDNYVKGINFAVKDSDPEGVVQYAHPLKSSSAQVGAIEVSNIAAKLERGGIEGESQTLSTTVDELLAASFKVKEVLHQELKRL